MSAPSAYDCHNGAELHVLKDPFGIGDSHANAAMRNRGNSEWGIEGNIAVLGHLVGDAMEPDVSPLATLGESRHELHAFFGVRGVEGLGRF